MGPLYTALYWLHVPIALGCIPAFWVSVLSRKGGPTHVRVGRLFGWGVRWVAVSGVAMGLLVLADPFLRGAPAAGTTEASMDAFLEKRRLFGALILYLGAITFFHVHHGVRVIQTRRDPARLASRAHRLLAWLPLLASVGAVAVGLVAEAGSRFILLAMSPIGVVESVLARRYLGDPLRLRNGWRPEHMTFMLIAGIAAHTAFAVFFLNGMLGLAPAGLLGLLPWLAPTLVGVPVIFVWVGREVRRLKGGAAIAGAGVGSAGV